MNKGKLHNHVAVLYPAQYQLVIAGGKLTGDWGNVAGHCFVQAVASEIIGELLGLDRRSIARLTTTAACHDWKKRLERKPSDFTESEKTEAERLLEIAAPDGELMKALNPWFLPKVINGEATFLQLVQFLIDDMTRNDEFVTFDERVDEASTRNPNPEPEVDKLLGRPYWEAERMIGHRVEAMVCAIFSARCQMIPEPKVLVRYVNAMLNERFPD